MPSVGQTTDELVIVEWLKKEGDAVALGESLFSVQTDKAQVEVESIAAGTLLKVLRDAGDTVRSGSPVAYIGAPGEAVPDVSEASAAIPAVSASAESTSPAPVTRSEPERRSPERTAGEDCGAAGCAALGERTWHRPDDARGYGAGRCHHRSRRRARERRRGRREVTTAAAVVSRWSDDEAAGCKTELELRAYTSRLLGQDSRLVLHGGGNTSVKLAETNIFGETEDILWVKGSGWDMASIKPAGFAPVRIRHLQSLAKLPALSDTDMAREFRVATIDPAAPSPSVEAILHAIVPFKWVDHTHADAVITLTNSVTRRRIDREGLRRSSPPNPVRDARIQAGPPVRRAVSPRAWPADDRHGADEPRHLHVG